MINPSELEWDTTHHGWVSEDKLLCPSKKAYECADVHLV